jgi:hypothetical protein
MDEIGMTLDLTKPQLMLVQAALSIHFTGPAEGDQWDNQDDYLESQVDGQAHEPCVLVAESEEMDQAMDRFRKLSDREALILEMRLGLDDWDDHTLQEVGEILGLTREGVRQIEKSAFRKLAANQPAVDRLTPLQNQKARSKQCQLGRKRPSLKHQEDVEVQAEPLGCRLKDHPATSELYYSDRQVAWGSANQAWRTNHSGQFPTSTQLLQIAWGLGYLQQDKGNKPPRRKKDIEATAKQLERATKQVKKANGIVFLTCSQQLAVLEKIGFKYHPPKAVKCKGANHALRRQEDQSQSQAKS